MVIQIVSPHFTAAIKLSGFRVYEAAPILRYMIGWGIDQVVTYCNRKAWTIVPIE